MAGAWRWPHLASRLRRGAAICHATYMPSWRVWCSVVRAVGTRDQHLYVWPLLSLPSVIRLLESTKINSSPLWRRPRVGKPCDVSCNCLHRGTGWNLQKLPSLALCSNYLTTRQAKPMGQSSLLLLPATEIVQVSELRHTVETRTVTGQWKVRIQTDRYSPFHTA
jgi:hypothetical protein